MSNLRDQLKKAKILSKKDAKRLAHEERVRRSEVGRQTLEGEDKARRDGIEAKRKATREKDREREAARAASRKQAEELAACNAILASEVLGLGRRGAGSVQWFFETESGHLPWLMLDATQVAQLQSGNLSVVRTGAAHTHVYGLLATEHAMRIRKVMPERVVFSTKLAS